MTKHVPIILLVSERSGSNLLRTLIGNHKDVCAPVSPHLMAEFYNIRKYYGDLRKKEAAELLINDMLRLANHPYHDWKLHVTQKDLIGNVNSVVSAFDKLYSLKAKQEGRIHYCSKGVDSFHFIDPFRSELENVKFVHLVRDPRDHVASWMKRPIKLLTPYDAILKWKNEQSELIDAVQSRGLECLSIRYEDLISDTPTTMTKVLQHIGLDIDKDCFRTDSKNEESKRNPYWQNLSKPILKDNKDKFRKELSEKDILIIETIAKNEMHFFGYKPVTAANWIPSSNYYLELQELRTKKQKEILSKPKEDMGQLHEKWSLINRIRAERQKQWESKNPSIKVTHRNGKDGFIKNRVKYLSLALLGTKITANFFK